MEFDTVALCGNSVDGQYINILDSVDKLLVGAVLGKSEEATAQQIEDIENSLPFSILGFDSDNQTVSQFNFRVIPAEAGIQNLIKPPGLSGQAG